MHVAREHPQLGAIVRLRDVQAWMCEFSNRLQFSGGANSNSRHVQLTTNVSIKITVFCTCMLTMGPTPIALDGAGHAKRTRTSPTCTHNTHTCRLTMGPTPIALLTALDTRRLFLYSSSSSCVFMCSDILCTHNAHDLRVFIACACQRPCLQYMHTVCEPGRRNTLRAQVK